MNKPSKRAYRLLFSGCRYHAPNLSRLTIGYRRGTLKALRDDFRELCRRVEEQTRSRHIKYFATWVNDTTVQGLRRHAHIIWTSPLTRWKDIHPIFQEIVGDNCTCWLDELQALSTHQVGYCVQYCATQKGESVRYSKSKGWLPEGFDEKWESIRNEASNDATTMDLVAELNCWLDKQRGKRRDYSEQRSLLPSDGNYATLQVVNRHAFVKRRLVE